ncbi:MAG: cupin domain-containing protein [Hyphomicrobiaceae bacterium]
MAELYSFLPPGGGSNYDWANDHTFVKVATGDTGGAYTLMEDNLKQTFALGLHVHREHAETFYILEGSVDFYVDGTWITAGPGATLHIPPGVPHACIITPGHDGGRMLMIFQPSGFDLFLAELAAMTEADFADEAKMAALNERHDIIQLGPVPNRD